MQKTDTGYLLFNTIHDVLRAEKVLKKEGIKFELIPVPRNLSSDCGMCVKLYDDLAKTLEKLGGIAVEKCFFFDGTTYAQRHE